MVLAPPPILNPWRTPCIYEYKFIIGLSSLKFKCLILNYQNLLYLCCNVNILITFIFVCRSLLYVIKNMLINYSYFLFLLLVT